MSQAIYPSRLPGHLGGHASVTHIDEGTLNFLVSKYNVHSMLDVGCGPLGMVRLARLKGLEAHGIDGDFTLNPGEETLFVHDFQSGPFVPKRRYDLVWSVEFVEHVEERFIGNFLPCFSSADAICMTHALPGKRGHHHVNTQSGNYWVDIFSQIGYSLDAEATQSVRSLSSMRREFMRNTGLVFTRRP